MSGSDAALLIDWENFKYSHSEWSARHGSARWTQLVHDAEH